jgi:hypothetical protein
MVAVPVPDIFGAQGDENGTDEDEPGQQDVLGDAVVIDIGGKPRMEQLGRQGPPEPRNEGASGDQERNGKNPSHEIAFLHISAGLFFRRLRRGDTSP